MRPLSHWLSAVASMTRDEFCARCPRPFLVWWTGAEKPAIDHAAMTMDRMVVGAQPTRQSMIEHYVAYELPTRPLVAIGCSPNCDVHITDATVSRRHAQLSFDGTSWRIADLDSTAGTYVNDQPLTDRPLRSGDHILLGTADLMFLAPGDVFDLIARLELFTYEHS